MRRQRVSSACLSRCLARVQASGNPLTAPQDAWRATPGSGRRRLFHTATPAATKAAEERGSHVRSEELARLEAALFLAREPLNTRRLAKLARLSDGTRARTLLGELRRLHDASGSAFRVENIAGGHQLLTRSAFGPWLRRLGTQTPAARISTSAMETLAIVAYRQPVTRAEIESIRGVGSEEMLRQLLERDLVAIGGRADDLGRPHVYVTSRRFLTVFGLSRLEDLPPMETLPGVDPAANAQPTGPEELPPP